VSNAANEVFKQNIQNVMKNVIPRAIAVVLWSGLLSPSAQALTIGYDIEVQSQLSVPAKLELTQYHSEGFNGMPPESFSENLVVNTQVITVPPGETRKLHYNSASGGFWLHWKQLDPTTNTQQSGVLDLGEGQRVIKVK
jgi:hypothetical protein